MMGMPSCHSVASTLSDYLDGRLKGWDRLRLRMHLYMCPKCLRYLKQFELVYRNSGRISLAELPDDFEEVMNRVLDRWLEKNRGE